MGSGKVVLLIFLTVLISRQNAISVFGLNGLGVRVFNLLILECPLTLERSEISRKPTFPTHFLWGEESGIDSPSPPLRNLLCDDTQRGKEHRVREAMKRSKLDIPHIKKDVIRRLAVGESQGSIAKDVGLSQSQISRFARREDIKPFIENEQMRLIGKVPDAVDYVKSLIPRKGQRGSMDIKERN